MNRNCLIFLELTKHQLDELWLLFYILHKIKKPPYG